MNWTYLSCKARRKLCAGKKRDLFESFAHLRRKNNSQMVLILYLNAVRSRTHHQVLLSVRPNVLLPHSALRSSLHECHEWNNIYVQVFFLFVLHAGHIHVVTIHSATVRLSLFSPLMSLAVQSDILSFQHIFFWNHWEEKTKRVWNRDNIKVGLLK